MVLKYPAERVVELCVDKKIQRPAEEYNKF